MEGRNITYSYYAKIMLFGEYSVICDSMGLTIPFAHFNGSLQFINDGKYTNLDLAKLSNKTILTFYNNLKSLLKSGKLEFDYDLQKLKEDISRGLYFESSIPQGYGLGSSGALCAALFERYNTAQLGYKRFLSSGEIFRLKKHFSLIESFFHGVSSGIDPLLSYMKYPLWIKGKDSIEMVEIPRKDFGHAGAIFLINSGIPGKTEPLVNQFLKNCDTLSYKKLITEKLIPANNTCILSLINGAMKDFFDALKTLSSFQLSHFSDMIPSRFWPLWENGLNSGDYYLKLCGSGGGGFLLGFTPDYKKTTGVMKKSGISPILVYQNA